MKYVFLTMFFVCFWAGCVEEKPAPKDAPKDASVQTGGGGGHGGHGGQGGHGGHGGYGAK